MAKKAAKKTKAKTTKPAKNQKPVVVADVEMVPEEVTEFNGTAHDEYMDKICFSLDWVANQFEVPSQFEALVALLSASSLLAQDMGIPSEEFLKIATNIFTSTEENICSDCQEESAKDVN